MLDFEKTKQGRGNTSVFRVRLTWISVLTGTVSVRMFVFPCSPIKTDLCKPSWPWLLSPLVFLWLKGKWVGLALYSAAISDSGLHAKTLQGFLWHFIIDCFNEVLLHLLHQDHLRNSVVKPSRAFKAQACMNLLKPRAVSVIKSIWQRKLKCYLLLVLYSNMLLL